MDPAKTARARPTIVSNRARPGHDKPFADYVLGAPFDEMFAPTVRRARMRPALYETLTTLPADELVRRQQTCEQSFLHQGITFTVYGDEAGDGEDHSDRSSAAHRSGRGVGQARARVDAAHHGAQPVPQGRLQRRQDSERRHRAARSRLRLSKHYLRQMRGVQVPLDAYVNVCGTDIIRREDGSFVVLEDNLRVPSGVSYMLANREVVKRAFPDLYRACSVRPIEQLCAGVADDAEGARARIPRRAAHRAADAGHLQLGLLRARVPGAADGHRARRGARSARARQRRLYAHDVGREARRRDLSARRRRLHRSAGVPATTRLWASPD